MLRRGRVWTEYPSRLSAEWQMTMANNDYKFTINLIN